MVGLFVLLAPLWCFFFNTDCCLDISSQTNAEHAYISAVSWLFAALQSAQVQLITEDKLQWKASACVCSSFIWSAWCVRTSCYCSLFRRG